MSKWKHSSPNVARLFSFQISNLSEKLKASLCAETKAWRVAYGKLCNTKYLNEMEMIFTSVEDWVKRLNRPIKDLDDIRLAMETLKEIREKEITIDMMIGPIEARYASILVTSCCNVILNMTSFLHVTSL